MKGKVIITKTHSQILALYDWPAGRQSQQKNSQAKWKMKVN